MHWRACRAQFTRFYIFRCKCFMRQRMSHLCAHIQCFNKILIVVHKMQRIACIAYSSGNKKTLKHCVTVGSSTPSTVREFIRSISITETPSRRINIMSSAFWICNWNACVMHIEPSMPCTSSDAEARWGTAWEANRKTLPRPMCSDEPTSIRFWHHLALEWAVSSSFALRFGASNRFSFRFDDNEGVHFYCVYSLTPCARMWVLLF